MRARLLTVVAVVALIGPAAVEAVPRPARSAQEPACPATAFQPKPPNAWMGSLSTRWLRRGTLWMGYTRADTAFVADPRGQKIGWFRDKGSKWGRLRVSGRRLDGEAPALRADISAKYPFKEGFTASALYFSSPGCWQVVARLGVSTRYVFVIRVEPAPPLR